MFVRRSRPFSLAAVVAVAAIAVLGSPDAFAGSLDDFRDSVDRDQRPPRRSSAPPRSAEHESHQHVDDDTESIVGQLLAAILAGHRPGDAWSWGDTTYDGRGSLTGGGRWLAADLDLSTAAPPPPRPGHLRARAEGLVLADGSAIGFGGFALLEASRTPGVAVWHQQWMDFGASDRLGVTALTLEPRIVTDAVASLSWNVGGVVYGSENGLLNAGAQLGLGLQLLPRQPLVFEVRIAGHAMPGAVVADVYLSAGLEVAPGVFTTVGYRGLVSASQALHTGTVGVQFDLGFGGRRSESRLASR